MVEKGNRDAHRRTYSGGIKAVEESKHGREMARERYGPLKQPDTTAADRSRPQAPENKQGPGYLNRTPNSWVRGYGKGGIESAESKPNFQPGFKGKR
jgi:hypothetical protein